MRDTKTPGCLFIVFFLICTYGCGYAVYMLDMLWVGQTGIALIILSISFAFISEIIPENHLKTYCFALFIPFLFSFYFFFAYDQKITTYIFGAFFLLVSILWGIKIFLSKNKKIIKVEELKSKVQKKISNPKPLKLEVDNKKLNSKAGKRKRGEALEIKKNQVNPSVSLLNTKEPFCKTCNSIDIQFCMKTSKYKCIRCNAKYNDEYIRARAIEESIARQKKELKTASEKKNNKIFPLTDYHNIVSGFMGDGNIILDQSSTFIKIGRKNFAGHTYFMLTILSNDLFTIEWFSNVNSNINNTIFNSGPHKLTWTFIKGQFNEQLDVKKMSDDLEKYMKKQIKK